jgi:hypothetical protein
MRKLINTIIQILDGTPTVYGKGQLSRGQSVAELALVTPILIVLLMGLAEIGWFANNYLILLETTRVGARYGTVQNGDTSPLSWDTDTTSLLSLSSYAPEPFPNSDPDVKDFQIRSRNCDIIASPDTPQYKGFFNLLACIMLQSMDPLPFRSPEYDYNIIPPLKKKAGNAIDDIVVSAFALQTINPADVPTAPENWKATLTTPIGTIPTTFDATVPSNYAQTVVVGRWPKNTNQCTYDVSGNPKQLERNPFDYLQNGKRDFITGDKRNPPLPATTDNILYYELSDFTPFKAGTASTYQGQRGYAWTGAHIVSGTGNKCVGSEWNLDRIQKLFNVPNYVGLDPAKAQEQRQFLASQGVVLVEMFWKHELLLKNPVFNPVFIAMGNNTTLSVWAMFPVPAVEPRITFQ